MGELEVAAIGALSQRQLRTVRAIYEEAFPAALRVPFADLTETGDVDRMFVALDRAGPAGFAALRMLPSASWTFLRYFAVAAPRRNQGTGRQFWPLVRASVSAAAGPAGSSSRSKIPAKPAMTTPSACCVSAASASGLAAAVGCYRSLTTFCPTTPGAARPSRSC